MLGTQNYVHYVGMVRDYHQCNEGFAMHACTAHAFTAHACTAHACTAHACTAHACMAHACTTCMYVHAAACMTCACTCMYDMYMYMHIHMTCTYMLRTLHKSWGGFEDTAPILCAFLDALGLHLIQPRKCPRQALP